LLDLAHRITHSNARKGFLDSYIEDRNLQRAGFPLSLAFESRELAKHSWIKISQNRTLSVERIGMKLRLAAPDELAQVIEGVNEIIG